MKIQSKNFLLGLIFFLLMICWSQLQQEFKPEVQRNLLIFQGSMVLFYLLKWNRIASWGFYFFLFAILYGSFFFLIDSFVSFLNPTRGQIEINGQIERVMDMAWIWGALIGFLLAFFSTWQYAVSNQRNNSLELYFLGLSLLVNLILYF